MLVNSLRLLSRTSIRPGGIIKTQGVSLSRNLMSYHRSFSTVSCVGFQYSHALMNQQRKNNEEDPRNKNDKNSKKKNEEDEEYDPEAEERLQRIKDRLKKEHPDWDVNKITMKQVNLNIAKLMRNLQFSFLALLLLTYLLMSQADSNHEELSFQDFVTNYLERGLVRKLNVINKFAVEAELVSGAISLHGGQPVPKVVFTIGSIEYFEDELNKVQDRLNIPLNERIPVVYEERTSWLSYLMPILPTMLLIGGLYYLTTKKVQAPGGRGSGSGPFGFGKSTAKLFNQETDVKIKFKDVAGCDESKEEIMEFVKFLQDPQKYEKLGAKIPRGAILSGPPGTGKTLLAKATAGEAGVPFLSVSGSEFVEMFVGVGASRVRDLFKTAREMAPAIIFVDEIDAIGKERGGGKFGGGGNDEREATLNQLLVEMDGFSSSDHIVVIAGTNRPDVLDKALLRPGRFDRHISIDVPDVEGRKEIFKVHLAKLKLKAIEDININEKSIDFDKYQAMKDSKIENLAGRLAALTPGFAGADIANVCNEGALIAAREDSPSVETYHFEQAIERVIAGLEKKSRMLTLEEKKTVSYHEAGHAICGWYLEFADPLVKVSIIPRGQGALGYAQYLPKDQYLTSKEQYNHQMIMALGGRVSEELHFDTVTSGASDDFKKVTQMAQSMILKLGMSERLGKINYDEDSERTIHHLYSEETAQIIDEEVKHLIDEAYQKCHDLLSSKLDLVDKVAKELYKKEVLTREDMIRLCGPRPFPDRNDAFDKYIKGGEDPFKKRKPTDQV